MLLFLSNGLIFDIAVARLSICSPIMSMFCMSWLASQLSSIFIYPCLRNKLKCSNKKESANYLYPLSSILWKKTHQSDFRSLCSGSYNQNLFLRSVTKTESKNLVNYRNIVSREVKRPPIISKRNAETGITWTLGSKHH